MSRPSLERRYDSRYHGKRGNAAGNPTRAQLEVTERLTLLISFR